MPRRSLLAIACFLLLSVSAFAQDKDTGPFKQREFADPQGGSLPYGLFLPHNYDPKVKYPLVLFLHGAGERGMDNKRQLRDIMGWTKEDVQTKFPCFIVAPQCPNWKEVFQVYGWNTDLSITTYRTYADSEKKWKHFQIAIGKHYTGRMNWLFFFNDDWGKDTPLESLFRNVKVYEAGQPARAKTVNFSNVTFTPYAGGGRGNNPMVEDNGETVHLLGDTRKKIPFPYTVTKNTVLEFDFKSSRQGNVHGIGLDDDDSLLEYKWVQVDWSAAAHTLPKEPSVPLRRVMDLIPALQKEFPNIDSRRLYITGLSMGGFGTWDLIARKPDLFAAAVPICGGADLETAYSVAKIPIWDFHGHDDGVVRTERSRDMIAALWNLGATPRYTEYPQTGHDAWVKGYQEPDLLPWLFAQKRVLTPPSAPANLKAAVTGSVKVQLTWAPSRDDESGIKEYRVSRDGGEIGITSETHFTDTEVGETEVHKYTVAAINNGWLSSAQTPECWVKIAADTAPPEVVSVQAQGGPSRVEVRFNKPVNAKQAADTENYALDNGLTVNRAVLLPDAKTVSLETSTLGARMYTITIRNISDRAAKPNTLHGETKVRFVYDPCLVAHWRFDEGDGSFSADSSGNGNVVTFRSVEWTQGKWGKALGFDGMWDHTAWTRQSQTLDLTDGLSVACWAKKAPGQYTHQMLVAKHHYYDHRVQFILDFDDSQRVRATVGTMDQGEIAVTGKRIDARDWHHIALTYGNGSLELYIDGVSQGKVTGKGKMLSVSEPVTVGGGHQGRDPFKGAIDEVRIYNRALSADEIKALATATDS